LSLLLLEQFWSSHSSWYVSQPRCFEQIANDLQLFVAWLAGARFDIAYTQFKLEFGKLMGVMGLDKTPEVVTEVHETLNKSEL
jgi:hypothetical protein